jgi:hypothetical protein
VSKTPEGLSFADWWSERLALFCFEDMERGIFVDQKWIDLVPAYFGGVNVLRDPVYHVSTWNLTHRRVTGSVSAGLRVDGRPIVFYHFSGLDLGNQLIALRKHGPDMPGLFELREWYLEACRREESVLTSRPWSFSTYESGEQIEDDQRRLYRDRADLQASYPDPFRTAPSDRSFLHWYRESVRAPEILAKQRDKPLVESVAAGPARAEWLARTSAGGRVRQRLLRLRHAAERVWMRAGLRLLPGALRHLLLRNRLVDQPDTVFDRAWYLATYPDVAASGMDPVDHYLLRGAFEYRDPGPEFDTDWYLQQNPDVARSGINPLLHYLTRGRAEGRAPRPKAEAGGRPADRSC